MWNMRIKNKMW